MVHMFRQFYCHYSVLTPNRVKEFMSVKQSLEEKTRDFLIRYIYKLKDEVRR